MGTVNTGASNAGPWAAGHDGAEAFLVGGGVAPIAAAAFMIRDGDMLGRNIASHFLPRDKGERPQVLSPGTRNLALIGQFVELPRDVVFTVEYSVRSAQAAVHGLLGLQREAPAVSRRVQPSRVAEGVPGAARRAGMSADWDEGDAKLHAPVKLPADLGGFLFADVWVEPGGMPLTLLSALARLGLDPWDEAERLSKLPAADAAGELARSLAILPGALLSDPAGSAGRLVALLPGRAAPSRLSLPRATDTGLQALQRRTIVLAVAAVLTGLAISVSQNVRLRDCWAYMDKPGRQVQAAGRK